MSGIANFHKILKALNIPPRKKDESLRESYLMGKFSPHIKSKVYKHEWHKTWDNREVYLRSSYEKDFAEQLDKEKIYYEVENLHIKYFDTQLNVYRCAIPDFYLKESNEIVEIKSLWTLNIQNMKDKFIRYKELGYTPILLLEHEKVDIFSY